MRIRQLLPAIFFAAIMPAQFGKAVRAAGEAPVSRVVVSPMSHESDTVVIQRHIDAGAGEVIIPYIHRAWVVDSLRLRSGLTLRLEPGVVVEAKAGGFRGKTDSLLVGHEVRGVRIIGYGATIRMRKMDYVKADYERGEWRHGIDLRGSNDVEVEGLSIQETGGDGIYIGPTWDDRRIACRGITVRNCTMERNFRQGISIVSGEKITITNCAVHRTAGTNPQAGIDLEPASYLDKVSDIQIKHCTAVDNIGSGFMLAFSRLNAKSSPVSVLFENCLARGSQSHLVQTSLGTESPAGAVVFRNCVFEGTPKAGLRGIWKSAPEGFALRFEDCKWSAVATNYNRGPFALDLMNVEQFSPTGGIYFFNCQMFDDRPREILDLGAATRGDIKGTMRVVNPRRAGAKAAGVSTQLSIEYVDTADGAQQDGGGKRSAGE